MSNQIEPECPECEKLLKIHPKSQTLGFFLEWLQHKYVFANWGKNDRLYPENISIEKLLAEYFEIDLDKVDKEREQLLKWIREQN
jgi:hypothetical protein